MEDKDLKQLEQSPAAKRITESLHRLSQKDKSALPPGGFDELWAEMEEVPPRRLSVSPWWLAAAGLFGLLLGWGIPWNSGREDIVLAVADTVRLIERQVDTVYFERPVPVKQAKARTASATFTPKIDNSVDSSALYTSSTQVSVSLVRRLEVPPLGLPLPEREEKRGRNLVEENFPLHLLIAM